MNFFVEIVSDTKCPTDFIKMFSAFNRCLLDNLCSQRYCSLPFFMLFSSIPFFQIEHSKLTNSDHESE